MKKCIGLLLIVCLCLGLLAACVNSGNSGGDSSSKEGTEIVKLNVVMILTGNEPKDTSQVVEEINKITREKIGAEIEITFISAQNYANQVNLMLSSKEKIDLLFEGSMTNNINVALNGALMPLNDLLVSHGQGILEALGEDYVQANNIDGNIYMVSCNKERAKGPMIMARKDIMDALGVAPEDIHTMEDFGNLLRKVKETYPEIIPFLPLPLGGMIDGMVVNEGDKLTDYIGVLMDAFDGSYKVENPFTSEAYSKMAHLMREWFEEGLIAKDVITIQASEIGTYYQSDRLFSNTNAQKPDQVKIQSNSYGCEMVGIILDDWPAKIDTEVMVAAGYGIPYYAEYPEKSMELLNLMYTDADIANLLNWGIEGVHYEVTDEGLATFADGLDASSSGYYYNLGWAVGNQFLSYPWEGNDVDIWEQYEKFNSEGQTSDACGFIFDSTPVKTQYAAVLNVLDEYRLSLESGAVDPDKVLPEFLGKLKASGIDDIIKEKQKQLDEWRKK